LEEAPGAQLILYPQYPEVRLSGFLKGTKNAPSDLMNSRAPGRLLLLGVTQDRRIIAHVVDGSSAVARQFRSLPTLEGIGVFLRLPLSGRREVPAKDQLLNAIRRIHLQGWIQSWALGPGYQRLPCNASQCVGYTLEAELGIVRNGLAEPDFLGWEVKATTVTALNARPTSKAITLMTPEPTGGFYKDKGPEAFVRAFGYHDQLGREDRLNFGGVFRRGQRHGLTGLTLEMHGYDSKNKRISKADGEIALVSDHGDIAASWSFPAIAELWNRKHAQAAFVPAESDTSATRAYRYGSRVRLGEGTDLLRFLSAIDDGLAYYDPAIKVEGASTSKPNVKRRSQFRVGSANLAALYASLSEVDALAV
jgi:hypothetical protein